MTSRITFIIIWSLLFDSAKLPAQQTSTDTAYLNNINVVGSELMYNDPDSAIQLFQTGIIIASYITNDSSGSIPVKVNAYKNISKFLGSLGTCNYFKGNYFEALNCYFQSLELCKKLKNKFGVARSYNNIGIIYDEMGNYNKALEYYFLALQIGAELQNKNMAASALSNIGVIYYLEGNYPLALKYDFEALKLHYENGNLKGLSGALGNIGIVYHEQNELEKAVTFHSKAYQVNQHIGNTRGMALNLGNLGIEYGKLKLPDKELSCLQKALQLNTELGQKSEIAFNLISLGSAYRQLQDHDQALNYFLKAVELGTELGNKFHLAYCTGQIGMLYLENDNFRLAEDYLLQAKDLSVELGALALMEENFEALSDLYDKTGQYASAYKYHVESTGLKDSIFSEDKSKEIGKLEAEHEMEIEKIERERKAEEERLLNIKTRNRRNLVQYSGIMLVLFVLGIIMTLMGVIKVKPSVASGIIFLGLLVLFEFLLVLFDSVIDRLSLGEPAYKLILNAIIALCIFPLHSLSERNLKRRLVHK